MTAGGSGAGLGPGSNWDEVTWDYFNWDSGIPETTWSTVSESSTSWFASAATSSGWSLVTPTATTWSDL